MLLGAFPDLKLRPVTVVCDDEHVGMAYTITGTHQGDFGGIAATGQTISARGVEIVKFRDRKLIERWDSSDEIGIRQPDRIAVKFHDAQGILGAGAARACEQRH